VTTVQCIVSTFSAGLAHDQHDDQQGHDGKKIAHRVFPGTFFLIGSLGLVCRRVRWGRLAWIRTRSRLRVDVGDISLGKNPRGEQEASDKEREEPAKYPSHHGAACKG